MKRNLLRKTLPLVLAIVLALSVFAGCSDSNGQSSISSEPPSSVSTSSLASQDANESEPSSEQPYHIVMAHLTGTNMDDQEKVVAAINELTKTELNMTFDNIAINYGDLMTKLNLMLSGGDKLDILPVYSSMAASYISAGQIANLNDYILDHGQDILREVGEDIVKSGSIDDFLYGVPSQKESASLAGIVMRKDIVEACGIDVDAIHTLDDVTAVFAQVKAQYPDMDMTTGTDLVQTWRDHDILSDRLGVLMDDGQDTTVVNWYETESYKSKVMRVHEWYKTGYIKLDAATSTETAQNLVKAGSLFSYMSVIKPGYLVQANSQCNQEMTYAYIGHDDGTTLNTLNTNNVNFYNWGIANNSEDKEKAMQFLNFAYSNADFMNLLNWGIEGEHYQKVEGSENVIEYPQGMDDSNTTYHMNMGWHLPNQYIAHIWTGLPEDVWDQYKAHNDSAVKSKAFGFLYDPTSLSTELTALMGVQEEYVKPLETGSVSNVDQALQEFNDKLYAAGLQKIIDLKQEQLDAWLAEQ